MAGSTLVFLKSEASVLEELDTSVTSDGFNNSDKRDSLPKSTSMT